MKSSEYKKLLIFIRWLFIAIVFVTVLSLMSKDVVLSGQFEIEHDYQSPSPFFADLVPKQRVEIIESGAKVNQEPIYSTIRFPRPFQNVDVSLTFENPDDLFVEYGPQVSPQEQYDLRAINHPTLNKLLQDGGMWSKVGGDGFFQKITADYHYANLDQFHRLPPVAQNIGYYGVDWTTPLIPSFIETNNEAIIDTPLKGSHEFYIAIKKTSFEANIKYQDINVLLGADEIRFVLKDFAGNMIDEWSFSDDGETRERGATSKERNANLKIDRLVAPSVYILSIETTDDIILHKIAINAPYIVVKDRVSLAGGPDYISEFGKSKIKTVEFRTSARQWTVQTDHRSTLQSLRMARETVTLEEPLKEYSFAMPKEQRFLLDQGYQVFSGKGNIVIQGRGVYALRPEHYFSPKPWLIDQTTDPEVLGIRYLVTDYKAPVEISDGVYQRTISIDLAETFIPTRSLRLQLSIPGLQDYNNFVIQNISAYFQSEPVTFDNAYEKIERFLERELKI